MKKCICYVRKDGKNIPSATSIVIESDEGIFILYSDIAMNTDALDKKDEAIKACIQETVDENRTTLYVIDYDMNPNVSRLIRVSPIKE